MEDLEGRKVEYLRLSVTDLCNYRCCYCMGPQGICKKNHEEILSIEEIVEIARAAVKCGVSKIRLTGGEPLIRKGLLTLCRRLREIEGLKELVITTNGSLLKEYAAELKAAGVDRLNISLDTLRPDRFLKITRTGSISQVLEGLESAMEAGFTNTKINTVLIGGFNIDEILDFIKLTEKKPLCVRFIELMPIGESASWDKERFAPADVVLEKCPELERIGEAGVSELYAIPGHAGTVGLIRPMSHRFCKSCNRIRITSDGRLKPCLHSSAEIPLKGLNGCELQEAIRKAVLLKPERHYIIENHKSDSLRSMYEIGG